ncbi:hypothetical protein [Tychonema sp. LEGE 07203]|uniref:hypothetical protein n=1 Tax=Tychonema sp. LEGE 07203 TaxID=1828671 RepID=UPI00187F45E4|nr:hypothetical protein [Tychonema sp. LEGE 07203]MBE9096045.1 hypothetical protein [Tychonema sp. LEGE 07203]
MRYFLRFLLALLMAALLVVTYGSIQAVGNENSQLGNVKKMASRKSKRSNQVKQNDLQLKENSLQLKMEWPKIVAISIPENKPGVTAEFSFTVSLTNNTPAPVPLAIDYDALIPEIFGPDGQALHRREPINRQIGNGEYHGSLVGVRQQISTSMEGRLSWQNNLLQLILHRPTYNESPIDIDTFWSFDTLGSGEYQVRFTYETPTGTIVYTNPFTVFNIKELLDGKEVPLERIEVTGRGQLVTPFANFRLLQPVGLNNSAVEVDGIRFETFIPEQLLTLPHKSDNSYQSVQIGMRMTNNTPTPFYFSFYGSFYPELVTPDGEVKRKAYGNDWMRGPEESDFLLVTPGKSLAFFPDISLFWTNHSQFSLGVSSGYGGYCSFDQLKAGIYHFRFQYYNTSDTIPKKNITGNSSESLPIEKVWTGWVDTPFVEFRLTQS